MDEREATEIADALLSDKEKRKHAFSSAELMPERHGEFGNPEQWIVRYFKPQPRGMSIDDGDHQPLVINDSLGAGLHFPLSVARVI